MKKIINDKEFIVAIQKRYANGSIKAVILDAFPVSNYIRNSHILGCVQETTIREVILKPTFSISKSTKRYKVLDSELLGYFPIHNRRALNTLLTSLDKIEQGYDFSDTFLFWRTISVPLSEYKQYAV